MTERYSTGKLRMFTHILSNGTMMIGEDQKASDAATLSIRHTRKKQHTLHKCSARKDRALNKGGAQLPTEPTLCKDIEQKLFVLEKDSMNLRLGQSACAKSTSYD